jgi:hypothetical protein
MMLLFLSYSNPHKNDLMTTVTSLSSDEISRLTDSLNANPKLWYYADYKRDSIFENGIIRLHDGTIVTFAFISHHTSKDHQSYSYFKSSGYSKFVKGWFCCEVEFGDTKQPKDIFQLNDILCKYDGVNP